MANLVRHAEDLALLGSATSTLKTYRTAWDIFVQFLDTFGWLGQSPRVDHIILFVSYLSMREYAPSTIFSYVSGVKYVTKMAGFQFHDSFVLSKILKGCKKGGSTADLRVPITIDLLEKMCDSLISVCSNTFEATLFRAMFLTAFFGLCRVSELTVTGDRCDHTVRASSVHSTQVGYVIFLLSSKNNQGGPPQAINISPHARLCPVAALRAYLSIRPDGQEKLFAHMDGSWVTDYQFRAVMQKSLKFIQVPDRNIKSHSFRIGGATYLHGLGCSDQQIRQAGRWKEGSSCFKGYIR